MTATTRKTDVPRDPDATARKAAGRPSSRERILEAAADLFQEAGFAHVSLEAVAERAGVSKGGLLYNFPSKLLLIKALVANHLVNLDIRRREAEDAMAGGRNRAARAHLTAICDLESGPPPPACSPPSPRARISSIRSAPTPTLSPNVCAPRTILSVRWRPTSP